MHARGCIVYLGVSDLLYSTRKYSAGYIIITFITNLKFLYFKLNRHIKIMYIHLSYTNLEHRHTAEFEL